MTTIVRTFNLNGNLIEEKKGDVDVSPKYDELEFDSDMWNIVMDAFGWPDGSEAWFILTLQDGQHVETMAHNQDEGWVSYGGDDVYGLWDYSGDKPKQIMKLFASPSIRLDQGLIM